MSTQTYTPRWSDLLVTQCNSFAERLGLDDASMSDLRQFVIDIAREQYKVGNKSGIRWARQNPKPSVGG